MTDKLLHFVEGVALPFFIFASAGGYEIKFLVEKWLALWDKTRFFPKVLDIAPSNISLVILLN